MVVKRRSPAAPGPDLRAADPDDTRARLLDAAGHVFAEEGFQAAKVRDICARARVNVAAINYHFGDKFGLYQEVLWESICAAGLEEAGLTYASGMSAEQRLGAFIRGMLRHLYGEDRPARHLKLMTQEMVRPTPALTGVVDRLIRPKYLAVCEMVSEILGEPANSRTVQLCAHSVVGQVTHYAHRIEVIRKLCPDFEVTADTMEEVAEHIARFSIAALKSMRKRAVGGATGKGSRKSHDF